MTRAKDLGEMTVSMLRGEEGHQVKELDKLVDWLRELGDIGAISLSNALLIGLVRRIKQQLRVPVVCALQGEDDFLDDLPQPERDIAWNTLSERAQQVDAFVAPSHYYAEQMARRMNLSLEKVHVIHNGISVSGADVSSHEQTSPVLGYLARLCETKGLGVLIEAFILLKQSGRHPSLRLRVAGTLAPGDSRFVKKVQARLTSEGLAKDVQFLFNLSMESKLDFLKSLTVFSVPALCSESFGLYVIESLAAGVPVVEPHHSAFPELLKETEGGLLCETNSPASLAEKVDFLLSHPDQARSLGQTGQKYVRERFNTGLMAERFLKLLQEIAADEV